MLEQVRRRLRNLIQFVDRQGKRARVYTDSEDEIGHGTELTGVVVRDANLENYRRKMEKFIREHENHITIYRLKHNQPIHDGDLDSLEAMHVYGREAPLYPCGWQRRPFRTGPRDSEPIADRSRRD